MASFNWLFWLYTLNSCLNPWIYMAFNPELITTLFGTRGSSSTNNRFGYCSQRSRNRLNLCQANNSSVVLQRDQVGAYVGSNECLQAGGGGRFEASPVPSHSRGSGHRTHGPAANNLFGEDHMGKSPRVKRNSCSRDGVGMTRVQTHETPST